MKTTRMGSAAALSLLVIAASVVSVPTQPATPINPSLFSEMRWRNVGPFRAGRTKAATGHASQPYTFYIGMCNGGVWKTTDAGRTWKPIFDDQPTGSIGWVQVAPSDPNILYVGTAEGLPRPDLSTGDGVYKSTDAGATWTHLGLRDAQQIPKIAVDPKNPNRLFVAALGHPYGPNEERGIFRSTDGGQTFQCVLFKDVNTGGKDVDIDPSNPDIVYATMWEQMHRFTWDMHYQPLDGGGRLGGPNLPIAAVRYNTVPAPTTPSVNPGQYPVKLTVNGKTYSQPIVVKQDPRVKTPALAIQQVYTLSKGAYYGALDAQNAAKPAHGVRDQIAKPRPQASGAVAQALADFDRKLETLEGTAPERGGGRGGRGAAPIASPDSLNGSSASLAGVMNLLQGADVQPTAVQLEAIAGARTAASRAMARWTAVKTVDLVALNAQLKAAGLPAITP